MITTLDPQTTDQYLRVDFTLMCAELAQARAAQRRKDTPANRAAVADALASLDVVLDLYLSVR